MGKFLDAAAGLGLLDGDAELYRMLLEGYISGGFSEKELLSLLENGDYEAGAKYIHRLKGSSLQIGANEAGEKASQIERILRGKAAENPRNNEICDKNDAKTLIAEFSEIYAKTIDEVREVRDFIANS